MAFDAGSIETTLDIDRTPFKEGLIQARKEAEAFEKRGVKLKLDIDKSAIDRLDKDIAKASGGRRGIRVPLDVDESDVRQVKKKIDEIADNTELTARRSGNRFARGLLNPLVLQLGLIPGIAAAAAGAGALALGVLPIAIGAVGVAALKNNEDIKSAFANTWQSIKTDAEGLAQPLVGTFEGIADRILGTWQKISPQLGQMFKDSAPLIDSFVDGILGAAEQAIPRFQQALALSGPSMRGFQSLLTDVGAGFGEMTIEIANSSNDVGRSTELLGQMLRGLMQNVGQLVASFSSFWADVGPKFNRVFDEAMDAVLRFTDGGLHGLGQGLNITLSILEAVLKVVGPFADIFGQIGGYALSAAAAFKLFGGALGLVGKAWGLINPAAMMGRMSGAAKSIESVSTRMGEYVAIATNSATAGERAESGIRKIGNAAVKTASWLPLIGVAVAGVQAAIDHFWPSADTLADKIQKGGAAAAEARTQMYSVADGYNRGSLWAQTFAASSEEVRAAVAKQRAGMTELERAQQDAAKAQRDYDYAVDKFGEGSKEAQYAQTNLAAATEQVEYAQDKAAKATQTHTDKIVAQTNIMLGAIGARLNYQSSLLQMESAQRALTDAVEAHGVGSKEARDADIQYQQSILSVVNSLGARVAAENAAKGQTEATRLATVAMHQEIARLAVEAGANLPPALAEMAAGLSDAELKAMGVTKEVDATGNAIYRLPPGKTLNFPNDAPVAQSQIQGLKNTIDQLPTSKWFTYYVKYTTTNSPKLPADAPAGGGGLIGQVQPRAKGGPVKAGQAYWTGDDPSHLPELFFPDVNGFVLNGRDSARIADSVRHPDTRRGAFGPVGNDGAAQPDQAPLADAVAEAFQRVLGTVRLEIDGDGWARVVNQANARNAGR